MKLPPIVFLSAILTSWLQTTGCSGVVPTRVAHEGMVVSADSLASAVGLSVLRRGGNAVDAAVAVGFTLSVTYPEAGNIGGGGFLLMRGPDGSVHSIDFRETAPRNATPGMYRDRPEGSVDGSLASGTPGTVAGLLFALEHYGTMDRRELLAPAIEAAARGFRVDDRLASSLAEYREDLLRHPSSARIFLRDGEPLSAGDLLVQPDLASTLGRIADDGAAGFYEGRTAELIERQMLKGGGLVDRSDLRSYRAVERTPLRGTYRGYTIDAMGPPSSGGICILRALSLLEPYDLRSLGPRDPAALHLIAEAMKRSFSLRASYLGDPDFVETRTQQLAGPDVDRLAGGIDYRLATPPDMLNGYPWTPREGNQTTHYSIIDADGMAVAVTYTINDLFGNKEVVDGGGFFLNDQMDDFVTAPGTPNLYGLIGGPENMILPGKRPLSSMSPTIVSKDGRAVLILGARGGSRIISAVLQCIVNFVDYRMTPEGTVNHPRIHHQWTPDRLSYEPGAITPAAGRQLIGLGHVLAERPSSVGAVEAIFVEPGTGRYIGAPDPREGGRAAGR